ncbi:myosin-like protein [Phytophthora infestans T30-4]|uniref:Myosin-like protein n=1 Tax=Phytophthora infestans (strain T30-4) TaxID=403677 RepID=D0MTN7_PHYIT|nr:myosin-like protein [Phytophthora infestans T30-4]EEY61334.1 myosin-like protein [Phytophthora infestans T30-4]|eukprot:XP_002908251.1 myosin-like protein [Phytophthora infestans T30-4]
MTTKEAGAGSKCYVPDDTYVWLPAQILREDKSSDPKKPEKTVMLRVYPPPGDTTAVVDKERVLDFNDPKVKAMLKSLQLESLPYQNDNLGPEGIEDMTALNYLHEAAILYNVKTRFLQKLPYTYTGDICIAVNPYQWLPELYSEQTQSQYLTKAREELPPHVYATSMASYNDMKRYEVNQSILVSGESGAGKTETTKILMNHLASIAGGLNDYTIKRIIEVNPLLESFGNAKTVRNDNSSRFGKFTQLQFDNAGILVGARCRTYLLEKTRVISHEQLERNYHIFYQLLAASDSREKWFLDDANECYAYTGANKTIKIEGMSDDKHFERTKTALGLIGVTEEQQEVLFEVLAGVLHLGQVEIQSKNNNEESGLVPDDQGAKNATKLLGISAAALDKALCSRQIAVAGDKVTTFLKKDQAEECIGALSEAIYSNVFDWLVEMINTSLENDRKMRYHVGILDIFGFEHFKHNSFEQFCINYANEKLQQKFTQDVFKTVQIEYEAEGILWSHIDFADNQDVISVIEDRLGIISLLNDEVMRPKGNDESFVSKLSTIHKDEQDVIEFPRTSRTQFTIKHYAGAVTYESLGFLEKHKDALLPDLSDLMRGSSKQFLRTIFTEKIGSPVASRKKSTSNARRGGRAMGGSLTVTNVGTQFKDNLNELMTSIRQTKVHYVRCIKPNKNKSPNEMDQPMVVSQLRCAGVIEAIRISRVAYPNRLLLEELVDKFWVFDVEHRNTDVPVKQRCEALMKKMELSSPEQYQIGLSRIYFRYGILEQMEDKKAERLDVQARHLQHYMRGFCCRLRFLRKLQAIVKLQSVARCVIMMNRYQSFKTAVITLQAHWRGYKGRCIALEAKKNKSAIIIQKYGRRLVKRKQFKDERKGAVKIQAFLRMKYERPKYMKALQEKKQQAVMEYQLSKLQERLHDEQRRNAELKKDRLSNSSTDSQLYAETNGTRSRGRSTAHMWMADADGIISQLNEEANRLRKENEEQRALTAQLKSEVEKLKFDQTVLTANFQVKIRGFQDVIREKDKKLEAVERECVKLREHVGSDPMQSSQKSLRKDRRSVFRRLGSKKEFDDGYDNGDASRASTAMQAALAQRSADTAQFLRQSARRMSRTKMWRNNSGGDSDGEGRFSGSDIGDSGGRPSLLQEVSAAGAGAMESLKNRLTAVKEKYYGEEGPSAASRQNAEPRRASAARESFNLDALPLPPGWETRLSRSKGKAYYCNPELRITQWDHPSIESSKVKKQAAVAAHRTKRGTSIMGSTVGSPLRDSIDGVLTMEGHI